MCTGFICCIKTKQVDERIRAEIKTAKKKAKDKVKNLTEVSNTMPMALTLEMQAAQMGLPMK